MAPPYVFIADFFSHEIVGGGELNNEELIKILQEKGNEVISLKSSQTSQDMIERYAGAYFIIANFMALREESKDKIMSEQYIIYEHDHKYLKSRNPAKYENFIAPSTEIINYEFYKHAKGVFCQSEFHADIVRKNLKLDNIFSVGGNLWSENCFAQMEILAAKPKQNKCSIMLSSIWHKNTDDAVSYCKYKEMEYELIPPSSHHAFLDRISNNSKLVFFPKTPETLSRIVVEARMMNMGVVTNELVGASGESWFNEKGESLIAIMKNRREEIPLKVMRVFNENFTDS